MPDPIIEPQDAISAEVRRWVDQEVIPVVEELEHNNIFPEQLVEGMKQLGLFELMIPQDQGGIGASYVTYSGVVEELARGWMSLGGILNTHVIVTHLVTEFGTDQQKTKYLPQMSNALRRGALTITEPNAGSDVQAIETVASLKDKHYVVNGSKLFVSNGRRGGIFAMAVKTDPNTKPRYKGISCLLVEPEFEGFNVTRDIEKLGYKGIEAAELSIDNMRVPQENLLGGEEGQGFFQVLSGVEVGRVNTAARAVGVARAAFEASIKYAQQRKAFGKQIGDHQAIQLKLADMYTNITAARLLARWAAGIKDQGGRADTEVGMAKLFATEVATEATLETMRIHGGIGYTKELPVERYFRDAPGMMIYEGTNEIQRTIIAKNLLQRYALD
jgi:alkylation response protein AidB-like acyl-CoA dehydrogenase|tara:strand:+ start:1328 stop:2488 length:1161 start_codon:yes stop_codon:yes gene_type:complete